jgi:hypothetical protein
MNEKFMEVYVSDQGLTPEGRYKAGTHLCFDEDFLISRPAIDQYQIVKSCISILEDVLFNLEEEVKAENEFFNAEAAKAMEKLWDKINCPKKPEN